MLQSQGNPSNTFPSKAFTHFPPARGNKLCCLFGKMDLWGKIIHTQHAVEDEDLEGNCLQGSRGKIAPTFSKTAHLPDMYHVSAGAAGNGGKPSKGKGRIGPRNHPGNSANTREVYVGAIQPSLFLLPPLASLIMVKRSPPPSLAHLDSPRNEG